MHTIYEQTTSTSDRIIVSAASIKISVLCLPTTITQHVATVFQSQYNTSKIRFEVYGNGSPVTNKLPLRIEACTVFQLW